MVLKYDKHVNPELVQSLSGGVAMGKSKKTTRNAG